MTLLDRYLVGALLMGTGLAAAVLLGLFGFMDLVEQLEDVGDGSFGTLDAAWQTLLAMPRRLAQLLPFAALMGGIAALGGLANHQELVAMRAAGLSVRRLAVTVVEAAVVLVVILVALEQFIAPTLDYTALEARNRAMGDSGETGRDWWLRDGHVILRIGDMRHGRVPADLELMELAPDMALARFVHAGHADIIAEDLWLLRDVTVKTFSAGAEPRHQHTLEWRPPTGIGRITRLQLAAESLAPLELFRYIAYLEAAGRPSGQYALVLWQKLAAAINTLAMALLALGFVFGTPRSGLGARLLLGAVTGISFFLLAQLGGQAGLVVGLAPALVTLGPALAMLAVALLVLRRQGPG
ncbi:MAG: LPS export ABC transporter permease LptG [Gammaproteobacteria bacterium]|nr:LPS export ABC transporter permease LptG [Gammaproteobacteria bacterium]